MISNRLAKFDNRCLGVRRPLRRRCRDGGRLCLFLSKPVHNVVCGMNLIQSFLYKFHRGLWCKRQKEFPTVETKIYTARVGTTTRNPNGSRRWQSQESSKDKQGRPQQESRLVESLCWVVWSLGAHKDPLGQLLLAKRGMPECLAAGCLCERRPVENFSSAPRLSVHPSQVVPLFRPTQQIFKVRVNHDRGILTFPKATIQ